MNSYPVRSFSDPHVDGFDYYGLLLLFLFLFRARHEETIEHCFRDPTGSVEKCSREHGVRPAVLLPPPGRPRGRRRDQVQGRRRLPLLWVRPERRLRAVQHVRGYGANIDNITDHRISYDSRAFRFIALPHATLRQDPSGRDITEHAMKILTQCATGGASIFMRDGGTVTHHVDLRYRFSFGSSFSFSFGFNADFDFSFHLNLNFNFRFAFSYAFNMNFPPMQIYLYFRAIS